MTTHQALYPQKGFTLLEILLVIAAIGILAAIVIVAINPQRQLAQVRDTERSSDLNTLQRALDQYLIENGEYPESIEFGYKEICDTGNSSWNQGVLYSECYDARELVPKYIPSIPRDSESTSQTGYFISMHPINQRISLYAPESELASPLMLNGFRWSPENISGLILWLDASDEDSVTHENGIVTSWQDKSPLGSVVNQSEPSRRPTWSNGEMSFSGNQQLTTDLNITGDRLMQGMTLVKVMRIEPTGSNQMSGALGVRRLYVGYRENARMIFGYGAATMFNTPISHPQHNNIYFITKRNDRVWNYFNGLQGSNSLVNLGSGNALFFIGDLGAGLHFVTGQINEVLVTETEMSMEEQQLLEGYLAYKWNSVDELSNDHPYKNILFPEIIFDLE